MNLADLYRQVILDHSQRPRHFHELNDALPITLRNPSCGDELTLFLRMEAGVITEAAFVGSGCSISMASASMLIESIHGMTVEQALTLDKEFRKLMQGQDADGEVLGELEALGGVRQFPARVKCAMLAWSALEQGMRTD